jgi:adenylosuccinate synthase
VYEEPEPYTFHLLPSGARANDQAWLVLGPGAVIAVPRLLQEVADCGVSQERLWIDPNAIVITAEDPASEELIARSIGSTRQGVGAATARKIRRVEGEFTLARDDSELKPYVRETRELLEDAYAGGKRILLEGTQGTGLSLHHGPYPYVTSRDTSVSGCLSEAGISPRRVRRIVMVCRTYPIRVQGTSGPMGKELDWLEISQRSGVPLEELSNRG